MYSTKIRMALLALLLVARAGYAQTPTPTNPPPTICWTFTPTATITPTRTPTATPTPTQSGVGIDIGPGLIGSDSFNGTWTIAGSGGDIGGTADAGRLVPNVVGNQGYVIAHLTSQTAVVSGAESGIVIRDGLAPGAPMVFLGLVQGAGLELIHRATLNGSMTSDYTAAGSAPVWLLLARRGSRFEAYTSTNHATWTLVGTTTVTMSSSVRIGMMVSSHSAGQLATTTFDGFAVKAP